jgi:1-deoxy-D-xylulose-5-phosphate reductoisomerase
MREVTILGSTGSVGRSALEVMRSLSRTHRLSGISARCDHLGLLQQIREFSPKIAVVIEKAAYQELSKLLGGTYTQLLQGEEGIFEMLSKGVDILLIAISGAGALPYLLKGIQSARIVAVANKESFVMAGALIRKELLKHTCRLIPVDSEHSGIFQILQAHRGEELKRIYLSASGGPFLEMEQRSLGNVRPEDALKHPTWKMGKKITIDSATMMNKALEIVECRWLFDIPAKMIKVLIHPQSIVHSMVEFCDGTIIAQMAKPDMKLPIQYALTYPHRESPCWEILDFSKGIELLLRAPREGEFPALELGYRAAEDSTLGAVMNAANEEAVNAFFEGKIGFQRIVELIRRIMQLHQPVASPGLEEIMQADRWARETIRGFLNS